jgi:hypothetical protein
MGQFMLGPGKRRTHQCELGEATEESGSVTLSNLLASYSEQKANMLRSDHVGSFAPRDNSKC